MTNEKHSGLNIGVLTYDYDPPIGGLGILAKTYVSALQKSNPESRFTIISPSDNADEHGILLARSRWKKSGGCPLFSLLINFSLSHFIRKHHLDVLHVHAGSGGVFLLKKPSCPVVVTSHHTYRQESALVFDQSPLKRLWKKWMSVLERRTYNLADLIVCVSADTRAELIEHYGIAPTRLIVIENPVPPTSTPSPFSVPAHRSPASAGEGGRGEGGASTNLNNTILFIGRLEERKGIMILLNAFHILSKEFPDLKLTLIGQNLIGSKLREFLQTHELQHRVTVLGHIDNVERFQEMSKATILIVPSKLEGFGLVAAEGMMMGMCIVASDAPGLRSIITDGETGRTFRSEDTDDAVRVLREVLTNAGERESLAAKAQISAEKRFDVKKRSDDLLQVITSVCQNSKNK